MGINLPAAPAAPDLNQPAGYNAAVLAGFNYTFNTLPAYLAGVSAGDWFNVQANAYDTTAGLLMAVGAFGVGGAAPTTAEIGVTDMNELIVGGNWTVSGTVSNKPDGTSAATGVCFVMRRSFDTGPAVTQILSYSGVTPTLWVRVGTGSPRTWSAWRPLTPERGSNANGAYVRLADGTMICTRECLVNLNLEDIQTFTLASTFTSVGGVSGGMKAAQNIGAAGDRDARFEAVANAGCSATTTAFEFRVSTNHKAAESVTLLVTVIGRWY